MTCTCTLAHDQLASSLRVWFPLCIILCVVAQAKKVRGLAMAAMEEQDEGSSGNIMAAAAALSAASSADGKGKKHERRRRRPSRQNSMDEALARLRDPKR